MIIGQRDDLRLTNVRLLRHVLHVFGLDERNSLCEDRKTTTYCFCSDFIRFIVEPIVFFLTKSRRKVEKIAEARRTYAVRTRSLI